MDFTNVQGEWKQIKAYIDSKLSKSVLPNGVQNILKIGEISSSSSKDHIYVTANVIRKAINDTKINNKTSGAVVLASCGMNLLMNYYNRVITIMFKVSGVNWRLLRFRSERSGIAHPVITSDFVVVF